MEDRLDFECPDCGEEFSIGAAFAADPDRLLICPCCGSTDIERVSSRQDIAPTHADAV